MVDLIASLSRNTCNVELSKLETFEIVSPSAIGWTLLDKSTIRCSIAGRSIELPDTPVLRTLLDIICRGGELKTSSLLQKLQKSHLGLSVNDLKEDLERFLVVVEQYHGLRRV